MTEGKTRVRTFVKVILAIAIMVFIFVLAFCGLGVYLYNYNNDIYPNVSIDGVDISWLSRNEASQALNLQSYDARGASAGTTVVFPDSSELKVTGEDVRFTHDARLLIETAYSRGRGNGFVMDTLAFIQRMYSQYIQGDGIERYNTAYTLDTESLRARVDEFTGSYNSVLEGSMPLVYADRIVIVKGAGQVRASAQAVYDLALQGLLESLSMGTPVELIYTLPEADVDPVELTAIRRNVLMLPLPAEYDPETKTISESVVGVDFDYYDAVALIDSAESGETIAINMVYTQPEVTHEYLENLLFRDLIGECVTQIAGTEDRLNNIVLASGAINGVILEPDEEFSFNRIVGRRTSDRGYKPAPAFSGGQTIQAIGGGICQVSSTIYSAIKDSDIRIKERHAHGKPVTYLPRGRDATVSWGSLDFQFINNTKYPLRVDIDVNDRTLTVKVFGTLNESEQVKPVP